jgi:hypothetical protein
MTDQFKGGLPELKFISLGTETRPKHKSEFLLSLPDMPLEVALTRAVQNPTEAG